MALRNFLEEALKDEEKQAQSITGIDPGWLMRLSELAKREMAVKVHSDILQCDVWLCSNKTIAQKVVADDPEAITYTVAEMRQLIKLAPSTEDIKRIHDAKAVFPGSTVVDGQRKDDKGGNNGSIKTVAIEGKLVKLSYDKEGGTITIQKNGKTYVALDFEPEFAAYRKYFDGGDGLG